MIKHRVFVTGATGYVGSAVAWRLARAGHIVHGLTRNPDLAPSLEAARVQPVLGDLAEAGGWLGVLQNCDAVVHVASDPQSTAERDQNALDAFRAAALDGRVRRVLYTSGIWVNGQAGAAVQDESTPLRPLELVQWRAAHEEIALDLSAHEVTTVILRPGVVYGGGGGILGEWFAEAREKRTVTYAGDGSQHWPMVHREDVADAYRLALEHGENGQRFLLADDSRDTVRKMAEAAADASGATAKAMPADEVVRLHGLYGKALLADLQVSSARARRELGWVPRHTSFVQEASQLWRAWQDAKVAKVA